MDVLNALVLVVTYCKKTGERTCARSPASAPKLVASKRSLFSDAVLALAQPLVRPLVAVARSADMRRARRTPVRAWYAFCPRPSCCALLPSIRRTPPLLERAAAGRQGTVAGKVGGSSLAFTTCARVLPALPPLARGSLRARAAAHNSASDGGGGTFDSHGRCVTCATHLSSDSGSPHSRPAAEPAAPPPSTSVPTLRSSLRALPAPARPDSQRWPSDISGERFRRRERLSGAYTLPRGRPALTLWHR